MKRVNKIGVGVQVTIFLSREAGGTINITAISLMLYNGFMVETLLDDTIKNPIDMDTIDKLAITDKFLESFV